jgi:hypothetical protein
MSFCLFTKFLMPDVVASSLLVGSLAFRTPYRVCSCCTLLQVRFHFHELALGLFIDLVGIIESFKGLREWKEY